MLFITNRFPKQSIRTKINRKFDFDLRNNAPSNSVFFCQRKRKNAYIEIGSIEFLRRIKASQYKQILVYIHGFSNLPEDHIFPATRELQQLFDLKQKDRILVIPLVWPCDSDIGIVQDYWDDQKAADQSAYSFARVLQKFMKWRNSTEYNPENDPCLKRINLLAHSMGNRVLRETLATWNTYDLANGVPLIFRNTFLVAADIVNESLHKGQRGELICHASRNVIVYFASDDLALRASKAANLKNKVASRRLGHSGPENIALTSPNTYAVDCDDVNIKYDPPKGHSYFRSGTKTGRPGVVFNHIYDSIQTGRIIPDDKRQRLTILKA